MNLFANSDLFFVLLSPVLLLTIFWIRNYLKEKKNHRFLGKNQKASFSYKVNWKQGLILFSILLISLAIMRPQWGKKLIQVERKGIDIVFAIDVSKSMLAEDIFPNRLEKAKIQLSSFVDRLKGDRVGLVVFAGNAFVSCPLTLDYNALRIFINLIDTDMIYQQGTDINKALKVARECFEEDGKNNKAVILLTDGENHGNDSIENEIEKCKEKNIKIYTIGLGGKEGEFIPIKNKDGEIIDYVKDEKGNVVISRLDEVTLQNLSIRTKGKYVFSKYGELKLDAIYSDIKNIEAQKIKSNKLLQRQDRYHYFLIPALVILLTLTFLKLE